MATKKIEVDVEVIFIRAGVSKKDAKYLQISNGRSEVFANVPKDFDMSVFEKYSEDDDITLTVQLLPGTDSITLIDVVE